jgi:hypothetical protein
MNAVYLGDAADPDKDGDIQHWQFFEPQTDQMMSLDLDEQKGTRYFILKNNNSPLVAEAKSLPFATCSGLGWENTASGPAVVKDDDCSWQKEVLTQ